MSRIRNQLTRLLDIEVPVICAPMANVGAAKLAVEATLGGGFGFMGAGTSSVMTPISLTCITCRVLACLEGQG